jgi:hypothetical protein
MGLGIVSASADISWGIFEIEETSSAEAAEAETGLP